MTVIQLGTSNIYHSSYENSNDKYDLIFCDPPYSQKVAADWDQVNSNETLTSLREFIEDHLTPNGVVVFTAMQPFTTDVMNTMPRSWFRYSLVWEKTKAVGHLLSKKRPMSAHEDILVFSPAKLGKHTYNPQFTEGEPYSGQGRAREEASRRVSAYRGCGGHRNDNPGIRHPRSVLTIPGVERGWHPTSKPEFLMSWLASTYTNEGDKVIEPFGGSCPMAKACNNLNRICHSYEINSEYFEKLRAEFACP